MRAEFNSRVELQRQVLKIVNTKKKLKTQLSGLSKPALENWIASNNIMENVLIETLFRIAEKLFFIANKSQDQITEQYKSLQLSLSKEISLLKKIYLNIE